MKRHWLTSLYLLISASFAGWAAAEDAIDFNRDIRPIISENCVHCHGPDAEAREADVQLDTQEASRSDLGGYAAIVPGDLQNSEAWQRIVSDDEDSLMPPPDSKRHLTAEQKELVRRWIESGAEYATHWAYVAPQRPDVPEGEHAVDHFAQERLSEEGLSPSPPADRRKLIRRVSLDLIGLPPSPNEVAAFVDDTGDDAFEQLVDRLLSSPRFGERWARPWLDLARYADSNGFQADQIRDSWAYRDWVIAALNDNMPFDQFTIEQLAGDLLPNATIDQKVATGFHRTVTCNVEAGVHPEENRVNQVIDRVNTTATVWLGSTLECSQCHDHKYDPFSMKEYYELFAFFNNTPVEVQNKNGKGVSFDFYGPKMNLPIAPEKEAQFAALTKEIDAVKEEQKAVVNLGKKEQAEWEARLLASLDNPPRWKTLEIDRFGGTGGETFERLDDGSWLVIGPIPDKTTYTLKANAGPGTVTAIRVEALTHETLPAKGPARGNGDRPNIILNEARLEIASAGGMSEPVALHGALADYSQPKWEVGNAIDGNPKTGWAIAPEFGKDHWAIFQMKPVGSATTDSELTLTLDHHYGLGRAIGRIRISVTSDPVGGDVLPEDLTTILKKPSDKRTKAEAKKLDDHFANFDPQQKALADKLQQLQAEIKAVTPDSTLVMVEMDEVRETHLMKRGNYLDKGEKVTAATPEILHPFDETLPPNRLGFAKWLMNPENPLVARVTVNRWWAELFGRGIVRTAEDLGTQAEPPTHPELLDWLAVEFVESGWDMKHVLKTIVLSKTYQQDSKFTDELLGIDPDNQLLSRGPRFRMSAEMIRDNALAVSGLLSDKMEGRPIMPYQPDGLWRQTGRNEPKWIEAKDENRWRRGVYVVWRRAAPYPSFVNFDGPDRSSCVVQRGRTNTPLQALTLLNDPVYTEAALALAERVLSNTSAATNDQKIDHAFELVLNRFPNTAERDQVLYLLEEQLEKLNESPELASELIAGASAVLKPEVETQAILAAWYYVTSVLLNLDETVTKG